MTMKVQNWQTCIVPCEICGRQSVLYRNGPRACRRPDCGRDSDGHLCGDYIKYRMEADAWWAEHRDLWA